MSVKKEERYPESRKPTESMQELSMVIVTDACDLSLPSKKGKEEAKEILYLYRV